jgi:hypothetical protein
MDCVLIRNNTFDQKKAAPAVAQAMADDARIGADRENLKGKIVLTDIGRD